MENKVIATIDITRPSGRKIVRELEKKRSVKLEYPIPEKIEEAGSDWKNVYEAGLDKLSAYYGVDMRELKSKL